MPVTEAANPRVDLDAQPMASSTLALDARPDQRATEGTEVTEGAEVATERSPILIVLLGAFGVFGDLCGSFSEARVCWRRALLLTAALAACGGKAKPAPPSVDVRQEVEMAEKAEKARRHDLAKIHFERAVAGAKDPSSIAYARREYAETLITWGEYPLAIQHLEVALGARPDDAAGWHDLGMLRHNQGNHAGAIQALEKSRDLAPRDARPLKSLAALRWKLGDKSGAAAEYRRMLALDLPDRVREKVEWALRELAKP